MPPAALPAELTQLWLLHEAGALTAGQFRDAKAAVLLAPPPATVVGTRRTAKGAGGGLQVWVRNADGTRAVEVSPGASAADLAAAVGAAPRALSFQGRMLEPAELLCDAGVCAECTVDIIEAAFADVKWDTQYGQSRQTCGTRPELYTVTDNGRTATKTKDTNYTCNLCAGPAASNGVLLFRVTVNALPDWAAVGDGQKEWDGIGVVPEVPANYLTDSGVCIRPWDGKIRVGSDILDDVLLKPLAAGDSVVIRCDFEAETVTFSSGGLEQTAPWPSLWTKELKRGHQATGVRVRPAVECERLDYSFTLN